MIAAPAVGVKKLNLGRAHPYVQCRADTIPWTSSASATLSELSGNRFAIIYENDYPVQRVFMAATMS